MTHKAYLNSSHISNYDTQREIYLCGLDDHDQAMYPELKSRYMKADVIFISAKIANFASEYFFSIANKQNAVIQTAKKIVTISTAVLKTSFPVVCLVSINELEELQKQLSHKGRVHVVDFSQFTPNMDDDDIYYERIPHVHNNTSSLYAGVLSFFSVSTTDSLSTPVIASLTDDNSISIDAEIFHKNGNKCFARVYSPDELQLVPYVEPIPEEPESSCTIM